MLDAVLSHPLPVALDAERAVLGSILFDNAVLWRVANLLGEGDFRGDANRLVYRAMRSLGESGAAIDLLTLKAVLQRAGTLEAAGSAYVSSLTDTVPDIANAERYAAMVAEKARLRALVLAGNGLMRAAMEPDADATELAGRTATSLSELAVGRESGPVSIAEVSRQAMKSLDARMTSGSWLTGIPTGFQKLDSLTLGLQRGVESVVGARLKVGKTAFALSILRHAVERGYRAMCVEVDMNQAMLSVRLLAATAGVSAFKIRTGRGIDADESERIARADVRLRSWGERLTFEFRSRQIAQILAYARRAYRSDGLDLLVVDHVGHIEGGRGEKRYIELGDVSSRLIELARETDAAVVTLVQLNRSAKDRPPTLEDIRESGNIEQDARLVILLDRPFLRGEPDVPQCYLSVLVPKNEGETGDNLTAHFDLRTQRITEEREGPCQCAAQTTGDGK